jgi:hypothetical protein
MKIRKRHSTSGRIDRFDYTIIGTETYDGRFARSSSTPLTSNYNMWIWEEWGFPINVEVLIRRHITVGT